jgi:hypothetical protein
MAKNALADALNKVANRTPHPGRTEPEAVAVRTVVEEGQSRHFSATPPKTQRTKGRIGKKVISGFFDRDVSKQLARLAIDKDRSNEDLLREALNDLFTKYHLPPIA